MSIPWRGPRRGPIRRNGGDSVIPVAAAPGPVNGPTPRCQSLRVLLVLAQQRRLLNARSLQGREPMLKRTPPNGKNGKKPNGGGKNGKKAARVSELPKNTIPNQNRQHQDPSTQE